MERLREELRIAFQMYLESRGKPGGRDEIWNLYVSKRESYLEACCIRDGRRYVPLKEKIVETWNLKM